MTHMVEQRSRGMHVFGSHNRRSGMSRGGLEPPTSAVPLDCDVCRVHPGFAGGQASKSVLTGETSGDGAANWRRATWELRWLRPRTSPIVVKEVTRRWWANI